MTIKPIRTDADLRAVFHRLEGLFQADEGTPEADERDVLVTLIEAYENQHYAHAGLCRHPLDAALSAEQSAQRLIARVRASQAPQA